MKNNYLLFFFMFSLSFGNKIIHDAPEYIDRESSYLFQSYFEQSDTRVRNGYIYYKSPSQSQYAQSLMRFDKGMYTYMIHSNQIPDDALEYFFSFDMEDGSFITFPEIDPINRPVSVPVQHSIESAAGNEKENTSGIAVIFPKDKESVYCANFFVCVSLHDAFGIDKRSIRVFVDSLELYNKEQDDAIEILVTKPVHLTSGVHQARLIYTDTYGNEMEPVIWSFISVNQRLEDESLSHRVSSGGHAFTSISSVSESSSYVNARLGLKYNINLDWMAIRFDYKSSMPGLRYDNDRDSYLIRFENKLFKFGIGDFYPTLNHLITAGQQVNGFNLSINSGPIIFDFIKGKLRRAVQGYGTDELYGMILLDSDIVENDFGQTAYAVSRIGYQFQRDLVSSRIGLRLKNWFQVGLDFTKIKDSELTVDRWLDGGYVNISDELVSILGISSEDIIYSDGMYDSYIELSNLLSYTNEGDSIIYNPSYWHGETPKDNLLIGASSKFSFKGLSLSSSAAYSLYNDNIWDVSFNNSTDLDTLEILDDSVSDGNILDQRIMFNPSDLSNIFEFGYSQRPLAPFTFRSVLYELAMSYRLDDTNFNIGYRYNGPEFKSLANRFIEVGYSRLSIDYSKYMFDNSIKLGFSFYDKSNIASSDTTDLYNTIKIGSDISVDFGPILPSIFIELNYYSMDNGLGKTCPEQNNEGYQAIDMNSTEFRFNINNRFSFIGNQSLSISGFIYDTEDNVIPYFNQYASSCDTYTYVPRSSNNQGYNIQLVTNYLRWNIETAFLSHTYIYSISGSQNYIYNSQSRLSIVAGYNLGNRIKNISLGYDLGMILIDSGGYNIHMLKSSMLVDLPLKLDMNLSWIYYINGDQTHSNYSNLVMGIRRKF